jgi:hypothetical protein
LLLEQSLDSQNSAASVGELICGEPANSKAESTNTGSGMYCLVFMIFLSMQWETGHGQKCERLVDIVLRLRHFAACEGWTKQQLAADQGNNNRRSEYAGLSLQWFVGLSKRLSSCIRLHNSLHKG